MGDTCVCSITQSCPTLCDPMDCSPCRAPRPWDSPGKNTGMGLPCRPPGDLPDPGIKPASLALQAEPLPLSHRGSPMWEIDA